MLKHLKWNARQLPESIIGISENIYVFRCSFSGDADGKHDCLIHSDDAITRLQNYFRDDQLMVANFCEGDKQSQVYDILTKYGMLVMDYPQHYEGCPLLQLEVIHHFLRNCQNWLLGPAEGSRNHVLMHCEPRGWPLLSFMWAALLLHQKAYTGEAKTLDLARKQGDGGLLQKYSELDSRPSQLRYLHYITEQGGGRGWSPNCPPIALESVVLYAVPIFSEGGCRPMVRVRGMDPFPRGGSTPRFIFEAPQRKHLKKYVQAEHKPIKITTRCRAKGDVVLELIHVPENAKEQIMFRILFNTTYIGPHVLSLMRDDIDIGWDAKKRFPEDFKAEVLFSDHKSFEFEDSANETDDTDVGSNAEEFYEASDQWSDSNKDLEMPFINDSISMSSTKVIDSRIATEKENKRVSNAENAASDGDFQASNFNDGQTLPPSLKVPPKPPPLGDPPKPPPPPFKASTGASLHAQVPQGALVPPPPPPPGGYPKLSPLPPGGHPKPPPPPPLKASAGSSPLLAKTPIPPPLPTRSSNNSLTSDNVVSGNAPPIVGRPSGVPPPPPPGLHKGAATASHPPSVQSYQSTSFGVKGSALQRSAGSSVPRKSATKPLHWTKVSRAAQGSLWEELQRNDQGPSEFDLLELENIFPASVPKADGSSNSEDRRKSLGSKPEKVHLIDMRRANNTEIMLSKVKMPFSDLVNAALQMDDSLLDVDQVENLIKFCPTKEEMEQLKNYPGDVENLGKCEHYFLELMKVPRFESKLRVFSFKIQFSAQVSELRKSLVIIHSLCNQVKNSSRLKEIMKKILHLGNTLNQGTGRGAAVGFKLESLLKLADTRATNNNNKITLMHYFCKVLATKTPELLYFYEDFTCLEDANKIELKLLAEERQAISKGLERVEQELKDSSEDGEVSDVFRKTVEKFMEEARAEDDSLTSLFGEAGRSADQLIRYFGEDPQKCSFEQVTTTILSFVTMFRKAHQENLKQAEIERKKAEKEAQMAKPKASATPKTNPQAANSRG